MQPAATDAHLHATVLDPDLACGLAQDRPARLVIQLGIADLEVQADTGGRRVRSLHQRALVFEESLLDACVTNRLIQPLAQCRTEARRTAGQVFLGGLGLALTQTNAQIHVVLSLFIAQQAHGEVAGQLALLATQAQVGAVEHQFLLIQLPVE